MGSVDANAIDLISPIPDPHSDLTTEFDSLPIPPLNPLYFNDNIEFPTHLVIGDERDEFDLDFTLEDLYGAGGGSGVGVVSADLDLPVDSKESNSVENSEERKEITVVEVFDCACAGKEHFKDEFEAEKSGNYYPSKQPYQHLFTNKTYMGNGIKR